MAIQKRFLPLLIFILVIINITIWLFASGIFDVSGKLSKEKVMTVSFLDVGQGDAIYIKTPNGTEVLMDGGPDRGVLSELGRVMSFFDREIDIIIVTNPDRDHIGGFIDVLKKFKVNMVVEPGTFSKTETYKVLGESIIKEEATKIIALRGKDIILDEKAGVKLQILFPDRDVSGLSTNDGSIVARLVYGNTSIMLQGDAPSEVEEYILYLDGERNQLDSDILKVGHHGSYTSTAEDYVREVSPAAAVISLGKDNSYGHPHKETLETLNNQKVSTLRTDELGTITFVSDGEKFVLKKSFGQKIKELFDGVSR